MGRLPRASCEQFNDVARVRTDTAASGAGEDDFAAIESIHAFNATGQTALAAIITYTKPEASPAIFKNLTDITRLAQVSKRSLYAHWVIGSDTVGP